MQSLAAAAAAAPASATGAGAPAVGISPCMTPAWWGSARWQRAHVAAQKPPAMRLLSLHMPRTLISEHVVATPGGRTSEQPVREVAAEPSLAGEAARAPPPRVQRPQVARQ